MDVDSPAEGAQGISGCYEVLERANNRLDMLDEPCRTVIIVRTAWGIIENGGFQYFFENNFDGDTEYGVFTQAFRRVGLDEIALRFSKLVNLFPFPNPHESPAKRMDFLDSAPSQFIAVMEELENLIYRGDDIDEILNSFLHDSKS